MDVTKQRNISLVETVNKNMKAYSQWQIKDATKARALQAMLAFPFDRDFATLVDTGRLHNCPILRQDINNATKIISKFFAWLFINISTLTHNLGPAQTRKQKKSAQSTAGHRIN